MPDFMQLESPQQKQQPQQIQVPTYDPKQIREEASTKVNDLIARCKANLADNPNQKDVISSFSIVLKPEHKEDLLGIYSAIISEANYKLGKEDAPFRLKGETKGGSFYFVAGYYDQKKAEETNVSLSDETYSKLKSIIDSYEAQPFVKSGNFETKYVATKRKLDAIIRAIRDNADFPEDKFEILTPEELARRMIDFHDGKTKEKPQAICVDASLMVSEILRHSNKDASIIILHPVNQYGEETNGHTTSAVVLDGWIVDPALKGEAIQLDKITLDKGKSAYKRFEKSMNGLYLDELKKKAKKEEEKPITLEFSIATKENERKSLYLLEQGIRRGQEKKAEAVAYYREAASLDKNNFFASYLAGNSYKESDLGRAVELYKQCADLNPDVYLANYYASIELSNIGKEKGSKELVENAYQYAAKASSMQPDAFLPVFRYMVIASELGKEKEAYDLAVKLDQKLPEDSDYKKLLAPYLAKK